MQSPIRPFYQLHFFALTLLLGTSLTLSSCNFRAKVTKFGQASADVHIDFDVINKPSIVSNSTSLDIRLVGDDLAWFRYKLGSSNQIDCESSDGYSTEEFASYRHISESLTAYNDGEMKLCVIGANSKNQWIEYSEAYSYVWTKDTVAPTANSLIINANDTYTVSSSVNLSLSSTGASEMKISSLNDCSNGTWQTYSASTATSLFQTNTNAFMYVVFRDAALNTSACVSDSIIHDNTPPSDISALNYSSNLWALLSTSPTISWSASTDVNSLHYELALGTTSGGTEVSNWQNIGTATNYSYSSLNLTNATNYYVSIRVVDIAGNFSNVFNGLAWTTNTTAIISTLSGVPSDPSNATTLNINVGGTDVSTYRYKIGPSSTTDCSQSSGYSADRNENLNITDNISGQSDGVLQLCVLGKNNIGTEQPLASATSHVWTKDTQAPTSPTIAINNNDSYTQSTSSTLTLSAVDATEMLITTDNTCSTGSWQSYQTSWSYTLTSTNTTVTVYVQYRDTAQNKSACISDSIIHDDTIPSAISTLNYSATSWNSLITSPTITWAASTDTNPLTYEITMGTSAGATNTSNWQNIGNVNTYSYSSLSLSNNTNYYVSVRAVDSAGNYSLIKQGSAWMTNYVPAPTVNFKTLSTYKNVKQIIDNTALEAVTTDITAKNHIYTLTSAPLRGTLFLNELEISSSSTFTQSHVNAGALRYVHDGSSQTSDSFTFTVTNGSTATSSQTFTINITQPDYIADPSFTDSHDNNAGDGSCADSLGNCSLRAALEENNAGSGSKVIFLKKGTYSLSSSSGFQALSLTKGATLIAESPEHTVITMNAAAYGIMSINTSQSIKIFGVHFTDAKESLISSNSGSSNNITLINCLFSKGFNTTANKASAIHHGNGSLKIEDSKFFNNKTNDSATLYASGQIVLKHSDFFNNTASTAFGIYGSGSSLSVAHSSFTNNSGGSGIVVDNTTGGEIKNTTLANNTDSTKYAIWSNAQSGGQLSIKNTSIIHNNMSALRINQSTQLSHTLIWGNFTLWSSLQTCQSSSTVALTSAGYNIVDFTDSFCVLNGTGDITAFTQPKITLSAQYNGGFTKTVAMASDSITVNSGHASQCEDTDQRGQLRSDTCDIGAYEYKSLSLPTHLTYYRTWSAGLVNHPIVTLTPSVSGTVTSYAIHPQIPAGLSFNTSTGVISGTPTVTFPETAFTISALNSSGSISTTLKLKVGNGFYVDSTADTVDNNIGDGICATNVGTCTLRAAIAEANGSGVSYKDTVILVPSGTYTLATTLPTYTKTAHLTLIGADQVSTVISGNATLVGAIYFSTATADTSTVYMSDMTWESFYCSSASGGNAIRFNKFNHFYISRSTFQNATGNSTSDCGMVFFEPASPTTYITGYIEHSKFASNSNVSAAGGALFVEGAYSILNVYNTEFTNNTASIGGAVSVKANAVLNVYNSLFTGNAATATGSNGGGVIFINESSIANFYNSTLYGNTAAKHASVASIYTFSSSHTATVNFYNSTIVGNSNISGLSDKGVIRLYANLFYGTPKLNLISTLAYNNTDGGVVSLCSVYDGTVAANKNNSFDFNSTSEASCNVGATDLSDNNTNVVVAGAPATNGGFLKTIALHASSLAKQSASVTYCPSTDARGYPRTSKSFNSTTNTGTCDIGAYEEQ